MLSEKGLPPIEQATSHQHPFVAKPLSSREKSSSLSESFLSHIPQCQSVVADTLSSSLSVAKVDSSLSTCTLSQTQKQHPVVTDMCQLSSSADQISNSPSTCTLSESQLPTGDIAKEIDDGDQYLHLKMTEKHQTASGNKEKDLSRLVDTKHSSALTQGAVPAKGKGDRMKCAVNLATQQLSALSSRVERLESELKRNNLRILGIPEDYPDDALLVKIKNLMKVLFSKRAALEIHIDSFWRIGPETNAQQQRPRPVMIRFSNQTSRDAVFKARMTLRETNPTIFINEDLSVQTSAAFYEARALVKKGACRSAWIFHGVVYIRSVIENKPMTLAAFKKQQSSCNDK